MRITIVFLMAFLLWSSMVSPLPYVNSVSQDEPRIYEIHAIVTAYNENDNYTPGTTMANGQEVYYGAVANDVLPLNSKVEINGETFVVADRFGAGHPIERFDMYLTSRTAAERFGRKNLKVKILEED